MTVVKLYNDFSEILAFLESMFNKINSTKIGKESDTLNSLIEIILCELEKIPEELIKKIPEDENIFLKDSAEIVDKLCNMETFLKNILEYIYILPQEERLCIYVENPSGTRELVKKLTNIMILTELQNKIKEVYEILLKKCQIKCLQSERPLNNKETLIIRILEEPFKLDPIDLYFFIQFLNSGNREKVLLYIREEVCQKSRKQR